MANWWDWDDRCLERWDSLPDWGRLLTFPLIALPLSVYNLLKLAIFFCMLPFLLYFGWGVATQRPAEEITLEELRTRAEEIVGWFSELAQLNPGCEDVIEAGLAFSRHLARVLSQPDCPPRLAREQASLTLQEVGNWKGSPYFALMELASNVIRWCDARRPATDPPAGR